MLTLLVGSQWFTPVILAIQEAEIRKIICQSQASQIVHKTITWKKKPFSKLSGVVAQSVGPEFKPQYNNNKKLLLSIKVWVKAGLVVYGSNPIAEEDDIRGSNVNSR
jgi:hypothetical protein